MEQMEQMEQKSSSMLGAMLNLAQPMGQDPGILGQLLVGV